MVQDSTTVDCFTGSVCKKRQSIITWKLSTDFLFHRLTDCNVVATSTDYTFRRPLPLLACNLTKHLHFFKPTRKKWRLRRHFCSLRLPMQTFIWIRMAPELNQDVWRWRGQKNFQSTSFTMTNNISYMKCALKSVCGLADVGVPHGNGDGPRAPPRCLEESGKTFK